MLDNQKLQQLLDYAKKIENGEIDASEYESAKIPQTADKNKYMIFQYAIKLMNYDKTPKIVSSKDYNQLAQQKPFCRGVSSIEHLADLLSLENFQIGDGDHGEGIYSTNNFNRAVNDYANRNRLNVLKFKLADDATIVNRRSFFELVDTIVKEIKSIKETNGDSKVSRTETISACKNIVKDASLKGISKEIYLDLAKLINTVKDNVYFMENIVEKHSSTLAVILGIDAFSIDQSSIKAKEEFVPNDENYNVLFNRGKMSVTQDDYEQIQFLNKYSPTNKAASSTTQIQPGN